MKTFSRTFLFSEIPLSQADILLYEQKQKILEMPPTLILIFTNGKLSLMVSFICTNLKPLPHLTHFLHISTILVVFMKVFHLFLHILFLILKVMKDRKISSLEFWECANTISCLVTVSSKISSYIVLKKWITFSTILHLIISCLCDSCSFLHNKHFASVCLLIFLAMKGH